jgi:Putative zinc-finger
MRHIPEDELHAYLDQGLSRSQCVEIESHLAACASCQATRDGIAALRDHTTALLARLAPPRSFPAPFDTLRRRAAVAVSARRRRIQHAAWAASVVAALVLGWTASRLLRHPGDQVVASQRQADTRPAPAPRTVATTTPAALRPSPSNSSEASTPRRIQPFRRAARVAPAAPVALPPVTPAPTLELSSVDVSASPKELELDGMWRTVSWVGAQAEAGDKLPHIDGLPVVQVQVQESQQGKQPLMVVAQQLSSGEVIRTIEGPVTDVSHLLSRRTMSDPTPSALSSDTTAGLDTLVAFDVNDQTMAMQRGDRMIAITGALPPDSLLAMIRRLNAEMRSK